MNAADLFQKSISDFKPHKILKKTAINYWAIITPPTTSSKLGDLNNDNRVKIFMI